MEQKLIIANKMRQKEQKTIKKNSEKIVQKRIQKNSLEKNNKRVENN